MPDDRVFVDKLPLNLALLPLIHLLFPGAKIILALRDPRDVIVSCYRNRFAMNAAMFQFLSLETSAHYYDAVMALTVVSRAKLPLSLHVLRYEDLVGDLRGTARSLLEFLGVEWTDDVLNHVETPRSGARSAPRAPRRSCARSIGHRWSSGGTTISNWRRSCRCSDGGRGPSATRRKKASRAGSCRIPGT